MTELIKRTITSILLLTLLIIAVNNIYVLFLLLVLCLYEMFLNFFIVKKNT